jgi:hypothetical protein
VSLLAFYYELFPVSARGLRIGLYVATVYTLCAFLSAALIDIFWCGLDVSINWYGPPQKTT